MIESIGSPWQWTAFGVIILSLLALDLGVINRKSHVIGFREAVSWSLFWVALSLCFGGWITWQYGTEKGAEFLTGYVIEWALSVDNVFLFILIFSGFKVPPQYQHRVLFWGIFGALLMRGVFIFAGAAALERWHWVLYVFGGILLVTGIRLLRASEEVEHPERNPLFKLFQRVVPSTSEYHGGQFYIREGGKWLATPLLTVLVLVELTDLIFAVDSIPAIFAITRDPFIVMTSNAFAILGLRALYFCVAGLADKLRYLKLGLAWVLILIAFKMLVSEFIKIPVTWSLLAVVVILSVSVLASLRAAPKPPAAH